jgi:hypothetical protein
MATKTQKLARGLLDKLESSGLYDMFDMSAVPDVPQQAMERYVPPRGMPPNLEGLLTPETASRLSDYARAGEQVGGREWYNTEPLRYAFQDILGPEAGASQYGRFFDIVAATSPRSRVDSNIRRASYLYNRDAQGLPIAGLTNPDLPPGYGHLAHNTQDQLLADLQRSGQFSSMNRPKTSSFAENLKGNQFPMTIDTHNFSAVVGDPGFKKSPSKTQYKYLEDFQSEIADKLNMTPAQYQASVWMGAGTGVADARPFMQVFDDVLTRTAERDKKTKGQVLKDFIEGKAPLYSFAGAGTLLGGMVLAPENAEASLLDMGSRIDRNAEDMPGVAKKMRKEELNGQEYLPAGMPVNPYTFLMSQGADQGEAARTLADAYSEVARGTANAIGGSGGEMETLAKGLLFALTGQGLGGSPVSRLSHVLNNYDPVLPNTQEVSRLPSLLKNISPMTEEERKMLRTAGEFLSPL